MTPEDLLQRVLFRDSFVLVLDKPCGLSVHGGPKGGVTLSDYLHHLTFGLPDIPQLAHRLDRETSGCLVLGRNKKALGKLGKLFETQRAQKTYHAICAGAPPQAEGIITLKLGRQSHDKRSWWMQVDEANGQEAVTHWRVLKQGDGWCKLALMPKTGRTHQLRVHCAAMGWPILGDKIYAPEDVRKMSSRLMLHAKSITLPLYHDKPPLFIEAPDAVEFADY